MIKTVTHIHKIENGLTPKIILTGILTNHFLREKSKDRLKNIEFDEFMSNENIPKIYTNNPMELKFKLYDDDFHILFVKET